MASASSCDTRNTLVCYRLGLVPEGAGDTKYSSTYAFVLAGDVAWHDIARLLDKHVQRHDTSITLRECMVIANLSDSGKRIILEETDYGAVLADATKNTESAGATRVHLSVYLPARALAPTSATPALPLAGCV
jgi:hypothetical protein